ncbi:VanZ family protein [Cytobacillus suaedae]|nr:VanZ family protein [Cytobacillus suaedae]
MFELNYGILLGMDKQQHFLLFLFCSLLAGGIVSIMSSVENLKRNVSFIWFALIFIGMIEEYRQLFIWHRSAEFFDAIANLLGATTGFILILLFRFIFSKGKKDTTVYSSGFLFPLYFFILIPCFVGLWILNQVPFYF